MARSLVPIKVKILLNTDGTAKYPNFNSLQAVIDSGMDWAKYIDINGDGIGWHYDRTAGHQDDTVDSPLGQQWGLIYVPEAFALQAVAAFPSTCTRLSELDGGTFYDTKAHVYDNEQILSNPILEGIQLKQDLSIALTSTELKALDPNDPTPGIVTNLHKTWAVHKTTNDLAIIEEE
jgi:hypothetical protein